MDQRITCKNGEINFTVNQPMDTLNISPETAESKLADCKVGDKKWLMVEVEVTGHDEDGFVADVLDVKYADKEKGKKPMKGEMSSDMMDKKKPRAAILAVLKGSDEDEDDGY